VDIQGKCCRTNTVSHTATRGPGWIQAVFLMENIMDHLANYAGILPEEFRRINFYQKVSPSFFKMKILYFPGRCDPLRHSFG
jgi:xanthine dehydrogenase molybdopterin-binding subunit B